MHRVVYVELSHAWSVGRRPAGLCDRGAVPSAAEVTSALC